LLGDAASLGDGTGALVEGGRAPTCTDAGCTCIRIASIGHEGIYGDCGSILQDNTSALTTWLSAQSSASVDVYDRSKPTLTADFLSQYDVIVIQWFPDVSDAGNDGALWQFTQDEVNALTAWVQAGGGLITLNGYDSDGNEVVPLNTLLTFTSMQYNQDRT